MLTGRMKLNVNSVTSFLCLSVVVPLVPIGELETKIRNEDTHIRNTNRRLGLESWHERGDHEIAYPVRMDWAGIIRSKKACLTLNQTSYPYLQQPCQQPHSRALVRS
jgi:hypothetical protein